MINRNLFSLHSCVICALFIVMNSSVLAQPKDSKKLERYAGLYCGFGGSSLGLGISAGYFFQNKYKIYILRFTGSVEFDLFPDDPTESVVDIGLLYGWCFKKKLVSASASLGIAAVGGTRRGAYIRSGGFLHGDIYEKDNFFTVGIPVQIQLFFTPLRLLGIGLTGYGNINPAMSACGVLLCLQFGDLR